MSLPLLWIRIQMRYIRYPRYPRKAYFLDFTGYSLNWWGILSRSDRIWPVGNGAMLSSGYPMETKRSTRFEIASPPPVAPVRKPSARYFKYRPISRNSERLNSRAEAIPLSLAQKEQTFLNCLNCPLLNESCMTVQAFESHDQHLTRRAV